MDNKSYNHRELEIKGKCDTAAMAKKIIQQIYQLADISPLSPQVLVYSKYSEFNGLPPSKSGLVVESHLIN